MIRGFYNEQNNTVNVIYYDTNYVISLDCGKWEQGLQTTPNSQGRMDALAIDYSVGYVRLMFSGEMQSALLFAERVFLCRKITQASLEVSFSRYAFWISGAKCCTG